MTLLESYKKRLAISESIYSKSHQGEVMDSNRKLMIAKCVDNVNKFLNESFSQSSGVQRADMGNYKQFCLNLITVALPQLIGPELVLTQPMTSAYGSVAYVEYVAGTTKGGIVGEGEDRTIFNSFQGLGNADEAARQLYTSSSVVETLDSTLKLMWTPVVKIVKATGADGAAVAVTDWTVAEDGTVTGTGVAEGVKVAYMYNNEIVPQTKLPMYSARMNRIPLEAKARRIAIFYSQLAAFQANQDYGLNMEQQLSAQAVGELNYEIDTEIVTLLADGAGDVLPALTFSKTLPIGVNKQDHYASFVEILEEGSREIYDRTKKFSPNYMIASSSILPVLSFCKDWKAAPKGTVNGPYFAGTVNGLRVFVSPSIPAGQFVLGVNGSDMQTSAAVFAPYMPVVPTQLLQYADGGTTQGFSTMYDLKLLNAALLVKGAVIA